jgi:germacradienol/geosmin synthase
MVVQNVLGCERDAALAMVNNLMTARMQQFEQLVTVDLPTMFDDFGLADDVRQTLLGYAGELQNWMSGILVWHRGCDRYDEPSLLRRAGKPITEPVKTFRIPHGATGLGTSAAKTYQLAGTRRMDGAR